MEPPGASAIAPSDLPSPPASPTAAACSTPEQPKRRRICSGCDRPATVCLCSALPSQPIATLTQILILHHPHESRHKLATVPVLSKCLSNSQTLVGRRLRRGSSPLLDSLPDPNPNPNRSPRVIYLFPGSPSSPALPISRLEPSRPHVLIVFDGTWRHAKEMVAASEEFLSEFAIRVSLETDAGVKGGSIYDSDFILRKEPFSGCVSTMEAVARALRVLEPSGAEIEERLLEVLKAMVRFQASNLKPVKPRPKMVKKSKEKGLS